MSVRPKRQTVTLWSRRLYGSPGRWVPLRGQSPAQFSHTSLAARMSRSVMAWRGDQVIGQPRSDQRVQSGDSLEPLRQPSPGQHLPVVIDDLDVMVVLGPVISHEQHPLSPIPGLHGADTVGSVEETTQRSNGQVLTADLTGHVIPAAVSPPHDQQAHGLPRDLQGSDAKSADLPAATGTKPAKPARYKPLDADVASPCGTVTNMPRTSPR
jgi:hypothetical protein